MGTDWAVRPEKPSDRASVHALNAAAFETSMEADLVDALREDEQAWIEGLAYVAETPDGEPAAYALITRCLVDEEPALVLAPVATLPKYQRQGAGAAVIEAVIEAARARGQERLLTVLGHPGYYPRFGFTRASEFGVRPGFEVPDEAMMAMVLEGAGPVPAGTIRYPAAFGV
ncbi:GNAT family N-acetyltransferase [Streptomyces sp. N35]|uniref:GNAT family N-acetyltransferase n=1 Tax=Streptomyces sp. N35 TaxID=2795730 RepID=UPI001F2CC183|nr:N-acetyltransferase [Streptomyces sp. N35]